MPKILIVEDNQDFNRAVSTFLNTATRFSGALTQMKLMMFCMKNRLTSLFPIL